MIRMDNSSFFLAFPLTIARGGRIAFIAVINDSLIVTEQLKGYHQMLANSSMKSFTLAIHTMNLGILSF
jgi:hypothetical protein